MISRNIKSGLLLFMISILFGPFMVYNAFEAVGEARGAHGVALEELGAASTAYEAAKGGEGAAAASEALSAASARATFAQADLAEVQARVNRLKVSHSHGNLEGLLNVIVGLILGAVAIGVRAQTIISWGFVVGSWTHGGALVLGNWGLELGIPILPLAFNVLSFGATVLSLSLLALVGGVWWKGLSER